MSGGERVGRLEARLLRVSGRVQRVGYRRYALELAQELGLAGYAKNLPDGSVQILVQGEEEKLTRFLELVRSPPLGEVREVRVEEVPADPSIGEFRIVYGELAEELQEGFGAMQAVFTEYWKEFRGFRGEFRSFRGEFRGFREEFREFRGEFRDYRNEFRSFRDEFRDYRGEFRGFRDESLRLGRETLNEIKELRKDLKAIPDERLARMERDIAKIKARLGLS